MYCSVVIVAAGKGSRMGAEMNKQYLKLNEKEVLAHTVEKFEKCRAINEIIIVTGKDEIEYCKHNIWEKYGFTKIKTIVAGGKERQDSVYNGLLAASHETQIILIHDGARPLIDGEQIEESIKVAREMGACVLGVPIKDTIKMCDHHQFVTGTPARDSLWSVQTPQAFKYDLIMRAYKEGLANHLVVTDDSMMVEALGYPVKIIEGRYDNIKITTPEDLIIAKGMMR